MVAPLWPASLAKLSISEEDDRMTGNLLEETKHGSTFI